MKFDQLYSSSSANLYMVTANNGKRLLIECGVVWSKLQKALNYDLNGIVGCLCSHDHADHSKAIKDVMQAGIDVFASQGTFSAYGINDERRAKVVRDKDVIKIGTDFKVRAFATKHDAVEPLGFLVKEITGIQEHRPGFRYRPIDEYLLFATDTFHIKQRFALPFSIIAIECSYDKDILQRRVDTQDINETLAKRLLTSHIEKQTAIDYIANFCNLSKCREIHLLHMSGDNINKRKTKIEFEKRFFVETRICNGMKRDRDCRVKNIHNTSS